MFYIILIFPKFQKRNIFDLGVILDAKLTFAQHVDATVRKCNRMLGLLMRSVQLPRCPRPARFNHNALIAAYNAHVRSVAEYGSVVWSGAAKTHLVRLERMQHRFLMWLASNTHGRCPPLDYESLLDRFHMCSIKSRFIQADLLLLYGVFRGRIDCPQLTAMFGLAVPGRRCRHTGLFNPRPCSLFHDLRQWKGGLVRPPLPFRNGRS